MFTAEGSQRGSLHHADGWARKTKDGKACVATFATGSPSFRRSLAYSAGHEVVIRFAKPSPPLELAVRQWDSVNDKGQPQDPMPLPWVLRPYVKGDTEAWEVVFVPFPQDHIYLDVEAWWADEDGCGGAPDLGSQYAAWTFHLLTN